MSKYHGARPGRKPKAAFHARGPATLAIGVATALIIPITPGAAQAGPPSTSPAAAVHVANPYTGASNYVNPDWSAKVKLSANEKEAVEGGLTNSMLKIANQPTAVWFNTTKSITAGRGIRGHLDAALAQRRAGDKPVVVTLVLNAVPGRDCRPRWSTMSDLTASLDDDRYRTQFIDPIAKALADPAYADLRIATILEPDALRDILLYGAVAYPDVECYDDQLVGSYLQGIRYALTKLHAVGNVYTYLDLAGSAVAGWQDRFGLTVELLKGAASGTPAGLSSVDGFATNTASYVPLAEPFVAAAPQALAAKIKESRFYDWNPNYEESTFAAAIGKKLISSGFPSRIGLLIDTSRNGWGGDARPEAASTSQDLNTFVDESRLDRRPNRLAVCNQVGAGLGARPTASPVSGVHAYLWVKPPGESDGTSDPNVSEEVEIYDPECDPTAPWYLGTTELETNAMSDTPPRGQWHSAQFADLVRNAYPAL